VFGMLEGFVGALRIVFEIIVKGLRIVFRIDY